jgi:hypothetical protein
MDVVGASANLQRAESVSRIQVAVARKVIDAQRMEGAGALKLLEAAMVGIEKAGDKLVAAATGLGSHIDTYG